MTAALVVLIWAVAAVLLIAAHHEGRQRRDTADRGWSAERRER